MNPKLFRTYTIESNGVSFSVLHPKVYLALLNEANPVRRPKIQQRVDELERSIPSFPSIDTGDLHVFETFKDRVNRKYPYYYFSRRLRKQLSAWRDTGKYELIVATVDRLKERFPDSWSQIRSHLSE